MSKNIIKKRTPEDDIEMLSYLSTHEIKQTAAKFNMTDDAVRAWLGRLRKRLTRMQTYMNQVRTLQRTSQRIRKLTTPGAVPQEDEEEWPT